MIEFTKSYKTVDGEVFPTVEAAQKHAIGVTLNVNSEIAETIVKNKDKVVDILTTTANSKPKARKLHGGTKNRKKSVITDATTSVTSTTNAPDDIDT